MWRSTKKPLGPMFKTQQEICFFEFPGHFWSFLHHLSSILIKSSYRFNLIDDIVYILSCAVCAVRKKPLETVAGAD